jgi:hypothetical protein
MTPKVQAADIDPLVTLGWFAGITSRSTRREA